MASPLVSWPVDELDELGKSQERELARAGWSRHRAVLPCIRAQGPLLPAYGADSRVKSYNLFGGSRKRHLPHEHV